MKKLLLLFVLFASLIRAQCNFNLIPNDICYNYDTLNVSSNKQTDVIYICGTSAVVYDTLDPVSIKYRFVFIHPGSTYHYKSTLVNSSTQIWAKSGSNIIIYPGTNTGITFHIYEESGVNISNLSTGTLSNTACGSVTATGMISCVPTSIAKNQSIYSETAIWPNPSTGKFFINKEEKLLVSLTVINQLGEVLLTEDYINTGKKELSLEKYSTGIYFVRIKSGKYTETKKVILTK